MVSVVIPTYNRAQKLCRAVESVLTQGSLVRELIIVDDASSDETAQNVAQISDQRIRFIRHNTNRGGQAARNTGIRAATCEWIAFLDSDDFWLPESLSLRLSEATKKQVEFVHSTALVTYDGEVRQPFTAIVPLHGQVYRQLLGAPGPMFQGMLVRKQALEKIGLLDEEVISFQEWDTSIRLARHFAFAYVDTPTFVYDCSGGDAMSKDLYKDVNGYKQIVARHRRAILAECGRNGLARHMEIIGKKYLTIGLRRYAYPYLAYAKMLRFMST